MIMYCVKDALIYNITFYRWNAIIACICSYLYMHSNLCVCLCTYRDTEKTKVNTEEFAEKDCI